MDLELHSDVSPERAPAQGWPADQPPQEGPLRVLAQRRNELPFPAQLLIWALRCLLGDRTADAAMRERVAWTCACAGLPGALPPLVGLAACLARGPRATRFARPGPDLAVSTAEFDVMLAVRNALPGALSISPRPLQSLVRSADLAAAQSYVCAIACELAAAGLVLECRCPVVLLPRPARVQRHG
jgi:hypothetical protein